MINESSITQAFFKKAKRGEEIYFFDFNLRRRELHSLLHLRFLRKLGQ